MASEATATGTPADANETAAVAKAVAVPVWVGSGLTPENLARYAAADGFIVGSSVKAGGLWSNALDPQRVAAIASAFTSLPDPA